MTEQTEKETRAYRPSNSTEGAWFEGKWCANCEYERAHRANENADGCETLGAALAFGIDEEGFPAAWVSALDGSNPRCARFRLEGTGTWEEAAADQERYEQAMAEMNAAETDAVKELRRGHYD
jgi:hypothetical protein